MFLLDLRGGSGATLRVFMISENGLEVAMLQEGVGGEDGLGNVKAIRFEISVIKHEPCNPDLA